MDISQVLQNQASSDATLREQSLQQLQQFEKTNFPQLVDLLTNEIADSSKDIKQRSVAIYYLKNLLESNNEVKKKQNIKRWGVLDPSIRKKAKDAALMILSSAAEKMMSNAVSSLVAALAMAEFPIQGWPELVAFMAKCMEEGEEKVKEVIVVTFGYICEVVDPSDVVASDVNVILTSVVRCMDVNTPINLRLCATKSLFHLLTFASGNFEQPQERGFIVNAIGSACLTDSEELVASGFECFAKMTKLYYKHLQEYIEQIVMVSGKVLDASTSDNNAARQAVEFWTSLAEEESCLIEEGDESLDYVRRFGGPMLPKFLTLLEFQDMYADADDWTLAAAAALTLSFFALLLENNIVECVMKFVQERLSNMNAEWRALDAGLVAFGSILEGPQPKNMQPIVQQGIGGVLNFLKHDSEFVRSSAAWCLGKICSNFLEIVSENLTSFFNSVVNHLTDVPRVAANICLAIFYVVSGLDAQNQADALSQYFEKLLSEVYKVTIRPDGRDNNLRCTAFEAVNVMIDACPEANFTAIRGLFDEVVARLQNTLQLNSDDSYEEQQDLLGCLQSLVPKLGEHFQAEKINLLMHIVVLVLSSPSLHVQEEALMIIGEIASAVGSQFENFLQKSMEMLKPCLEDIYEVHKCELAISCVGDICRAVEEKFAPFATPTLQIFFKVISLEEVPNNIKCAIISCIGDLAMAVKGHFSDSAPQVMMLLTEIMNFTAKVNIDDYEQVLYFNSLRQVLFECFTGMLQGLKDGNTLNALTQDHLSVMINFLKYCSSDPLAKNDLIDAEMAVAAVGALGDMCQIFGAHIGQLLRSLTTPNTDFNTLFQIATQKDARLVSWCKKQIQTIC
eukprot:GCRY01000672.1.p1 GENE.GCRY01000672.1~~GCRY01000672.1.p1  ORF type:complete len:926 (+),score=162.83 GCRY01000672.1:237-2780(+)